MEEHIIRYIQCTGPGTYYIILLATHQCQIQKANLLQDLIKYSYIYTVRLVKIPTDGTTPILRPINFL